MLPGTRDRNLKGKGSLIERAMAGHLGSVISSMGRWRMRLIVPRAEIAEMLPLARLLSRSTDPAVQSRSKVIALLALSFNYILVCRVNNCFWVFASILFLCFLAFTYLWDLYFQK